VNTRARAEAIAHAAASIPIFSGTTANDLLSVVALELGHPEILDGFRPYGSSLARAIPLPTIAHIFAGNTPHAAFQSLVRGLLLGSRNLCKLPSSGIPELLEFITALPSELQAKVELLPIESILPQADAVTVFGDDDTIRHFQTLIAPHQRFLPHGHKLSLGVIFDTWPPDLPARAAHDVSLYDQQGCLSPHLFYIERDSQTFAAQLAAEMAQFEAHTPRSPISPEETARIIAIREETQFRIATGDPLQLWTSPGSTAWTVIWEPDPKFRASCLNRLVFVKPFPPDIITALTLCRSHISTIALHPPTDAHAQLLLTSGATRFCPVGAMQSPKWQWHHDGGQTLAPLVTWIDFDPPV
jgi:hypothetical protein